MEELDLKDLFKMFWSKRVQIVLIMAIFMMIGVIYTIGFVTPKYSSSAKLLLASVKSNNTATDTITATDVTMNSKLVSTYSELVTTKNVLGKVKANLNIDIDEELLEKNVKVTSVKDTEFIKITVTDADAHNAQKIANEIAKVFIEEVKVYYKLENVHIVDTAELEETPSNVNHKKDIAIFTGIGLVIAAAYVLIINMLDTTIKAPEEIEEGYQLPVLASIPIYEDNLQKSKKGR